jgi:hypothetical protein
MGLIFLFHFFLHVLLIFLCIKFISFVHNFGPLEQGAANVSDSTIEFLGSAAATGIMGAP